MSGVAATLNYKIANEGHIEILVQIIGIFILQYCVCNKLYVLCLLNVYNLYIIHIMYCIAICRIAKTYHANRNDIGWSVLIRKWKISNNYII